MKSIKNNEVFRIEINRSKFISYLFPVSTVEEANTEMKKLRASYPDANHHCYAYVLGNNQDIQKYSDDGEPSKTAGMPMIEVLKKNDLTNILAVTIRYFGGIKLGAGGLVRAYTKSVSECIKLSTFTRRVQVVNIEVIISFDQIGNVEQYLRNNYSLINTSYDDKVHYYVELDNGDLDQIKNTLIEHTKGNVEIIISKTYEVYK